MPVKKKQQKAYQPPAFPSWETTPTGPCYVNRLPVETLAEIFKLVEASERAEHGPRMLIHWTCAYIFCHVDAYWRAIALSVPELWTCVEVWRKSNLLRAEAWARHAKSLPMDVMIHVKHPTMTEQLAFNSFAPHMGNIENLALLATSGSPEPGRFYWPAGITSIVRLGLKLVKFDTIQHAVETLRSCPKLRVLSLDDCDLHDEDEDEAIVPLELTELHIAAFPLWKLTKHLLRHVRMPALQHVALREFRATGIPCDELERDLASGRTSLSAGRHHHSFTYNTFEFDAHDAYGDYNEDNLQTIMIYLRCLPIESLNLHGAQWAGRLVDYLSTPSEEGHFPAPRLRSLHISEVYDSWYQSLMALEPRYRGIPGRPCVIPPPLEVLDIDNCGHVEGIEEAHRMFVEFGTKFYWQYDNMSFRVDPDDPDNDFYTGEKEDDGTDDGSDGEHVDS